MNKFFKSIYASSLMMILCTFILGGNTQLFGQSINTQLTIFDTSVSYIQLKDSVIQRLSNGQDTNTEVVLDYLRYMSFWNARIADTAKESFSPIIKALQSYAANITYPVIDPADWKLAGPEKVSDFPNVNNQMMGIVSEVLGNPNNPFDVLIGTAHSGIWSYDFVNSRWTCVTDALHFPCLGITSIVRNKFNSDHIMASTGVADRSDRYGTGIIESFDGGNTWSLMSGFDYPNNPYVTRLIADQSDNDASDGITLYALVGRYIYVSNNSGVTWLGVVAPVPQYAHSYYNDLCVTDAGDLVVTTANIWENKGELFVYDKSLNDWDTILLRDENHININFQHARVSVAHDPQNNYDAFIVADWVNGNNGKRFIYQHLIGALILEPFKTIPGWAPNGVSYVHQEIVSINEKPYPQLFLGSTELGILNVPWSAPAIDFLEGGHSGINDIEVVKYDQANDEIVLLIANDGGVSRVTVDIENNLTTNIENLNGKYLPITDLVGLGVSQIGREKIVAGSLTNENFIFEDYNWSHVGPQFSQSGGDCEIKKDNPDKHYYQLQAEMYENIGGTDQTIYSNLGWPVPGLKYELDPIDPDILYAGREKGTNGNGRLEIYDMGQSTHYIERENTLGLTTTGAIAADGNGMILVSDLDFKKDATSDAVLIKSSDYGATWTSLNEKQVRYYDNGDYIHKELSKVIGYKTIQDIAIDPDNSQTIFLAISGLYTDVYGDPIPDDRRVLVSYNGGNVWYDMSEGLGMVPCHSLAFYKTDNRTFLFVGNEVGVFYNELTYPLTPWNTFLEGLPTCIVTEMYVRECSNELVISTRGRGIYKSSLRELDDVQTILPTGQSIVWDDPARIKSDVVIPGTTTLTIEDCTIEFMADRKIIVQPGGKLIVNNATLTNFCDARWEGIEVWGNRSSDQGQVASNYSQGYLKLINATIENAHYGARLWKPGDWYSTGGIIIAEGSVFRNCWKGVEFMSYENYIPQPPYTPPYQYIANVSRFTGCTFQVDDNFAPGSFEAHASLFEVWGIVFKGCTFEDIRTYNGHSTGIASLDASYTVSYICDNPPCNPEEIQPSVFRGLGIGIDAGGTNGNYNISVLDCEFDQNGYGIYGKKVDHLVALNNSFSVGELNHITDNFSGSVGMILEYSTGYQIHGNDFEGDYSSVYGGYGMLLYQNGSENNRVSSNTFTNTAISILGIGKNRNASAPFEGLHLLCNSYDNPDGDDEVSLEISAQGYNPVDDGIRDFQGDYYTAASNIFQSKNSSFVNIGNGTQNVITYIFRNGNDEPQQYSPNVNPMQISSANSSCSGGSSFTTNGLPLSSAQRIAFKDSLNEAETGYLNLLYNYNQLIDGGSTNALLTEIELSWPEDAWELRNELLANSPYLSEEVIREAASSGILPSAMVLEICLANPDATRSEELMDFLRTEIPTPMPEYMLDLIRATWDDQTTRTVLEATLANYGSNMMAWSNILLADMKLDTVKTPIDSIVSYLNRRQTLSSAYSIVEEFIADSNFEAAQDQLDQLIIQYSLTEGEQAGYDRFTDWFEFQENLAASGRNKAELTQEEIEYLLTLAYGYDRTGSEIRNLLCFLYDTCIATNFSFGYLEPKSSVFMESQSKRDPIGYVEVFPNPANTYLTFRTSEGLTTQDLTIALSDVSGRIVFKDKLTKVPGDYLLDTRSFKDGIYLYQLNDSNGILEGGKVVIRH